MSRLNPRTTNPAKFYAEWGGSEGVLKYYDRETKENVELDLPFTFLVLDELSTVKGFNKGRQKNYYSNEVYDITNDELRVKLDKQLVAKGVWNDIKGDLNGGKYTKSIYIACKDDTGELQIANLQLSGAGLNAWINFTQTYDVYKGAVVITGPSKQKKNGSVKYFEPLFEGKDVSKSTDAEANELNRVLDAHLKTYLSRQGDVDEEVVAEDYDEEETPAPKKTAKKAAPEIEDTDNKIDLSEVPF